MNFRPLQLHGKNAWKYKCGNKSKINLVLDSKGVTWKHGVQGERD